MAKRKTVPKTRCSGTLTESGYRNWIISLLRRGTLRWKPRGEALRQAEVGRKTNEATGRLAMHVECAECGSHVPKGMAHVDHIVPVVGVDGWTNWDDYVHNMFCEIDNLRVLCKPCHKVVTDAETLERKLARQAKKESK